MKRKNIILLCASGIILLCAIIAGWCLLASPTKIAFVNYQTITLGHIAKSNNNQFIKIAELSPEDVDKADDYDMVFVNGMGLRITDEQRQALRHAAENGTPVLTTAATNPQNLIISTDSVDMEFLRQYLAGASSGNYRSMLNYVRKFIDGKKFFIKDIADPTVASASLIYHPDIDHPDDDHLQFPSVKEYEAYLASKGLLKKEAPAIILTGQMGVPDSLVAALERSGNMVYPVNSIQMFISEGHADSITPAAVINMAHGRMGDMVTTWLTQKNIPLFSPVNVNRGYSEWMEDKAGMNGGFLSQSIVTPEIDGATRPFALFAHYEGADGLPYLSAIPDRLSEYVATVNNHIALQRKDNSAKKVAIFYFKGPGQNPLVAEGMEVAPSLYNLLTAMRDAGYDLGNLPASAAELQRMIDGQGKVFGDYAIGARKDFIRTMHPQTISSEEYNKWFAASMPAEMLDEINALDGPFPGHGLQTDNGEAAIARLQFGNVVLIPQTAAGAGSDDFQIVHGTDMAPPHNYVAAYLWARHGFGADALMHFGAHGSLEFTPRKQAALSSRDWPDRLVGTMPHFYIWATGNVGEAMMAKRRSYAGIINYLTPPFMESGLRNVYKNLSDAIAAYNREAFRDKPDPAAVKNAALQVKRNTIALGIHRDLKLDSIADKPYTDDEIARIETFAEELANEKITGALYVMGQPYEQPHLESTVMAMATDPVAYSLYKLDRSAGKATFDKDRHPGEFTRRYLEPARALTRKILASPSAPSDEEICRIAGITTADLEEARQISASVTGSKDLLSRMMVIGSTMRPQEPTAKLSERRSTSKMKQMMAATGMSADKALAMAKKMGADKDALNRMEAAMKKPAAPTHGSHSESTGTQAPHHGMPGMTMPEYTPAEIEHAAAIMEVHRTLSNIKVYYNALRESPAKEIAGVLNALNGGFIIPTPGGDPVVNPGILPTGRNMFAINAEETPSAQAWEKGKALVDNTLTLYRKNHNDSIPRKVSYTLWSSEFIETEGATIAQVLYMLGVEPVRDPFGRVTDLRLMTSGELGRPRIDVVVQTSGQLRDLAASRLFLIDRAVKMAAAADDGEMPNFVAQGAVASERILVEKGVTPKEARELSTARVFGGVNGSYGTGIQNMVEAGDRWEDESEIASAYINNMGAYYGSEQDWEKVREHAFEAALSNTDAVVQPRQSNTWGALSLDHVYEFMGGMNLAVRNVTGKDPEAYLSDYRNRNNARMQDLKEAVGVESRTTILNPAYIQEKMSGGAGDASAFADIIRNTYGWNVMKPAVIDNELWNDIYDTYVNDRHNLGMKDFFTSANPAALEEITAVMLETARKGMWKASPDQIETLATLHTEIIRDYEPSCSKFVCDNPKLREYISNHTSAETAQAYNASIGDIRAENISDSENGMVMKKEEMNHMDRTTSDIYIPAVVAFVVIALLLFVYMRRRKNSRKG